MIGLSDDHVNGIAVSEKQSSRQPPGGHTTICLSYDETPTKGASKDALKIFEESSSMKAAGGDRQAPGGISTLCLGYSPEVGRTPLKLQPPGGNASICLGVHDDEVVLDVCPS